MSNTNSTTATDRATRERLVLPFFELDVKYLPEQTARFVEMLSAFVNDTEDPTGLRVDNLREAAKSLEADYRRINSLLARFDKYEPRGEE